MRALEIVLTTGRSKVELEGAEPPPYAVLRVGLMRPREELHARIDKRVLAMIDAGWVAETARLLAAGYAPTLPAMTSLGYGEICAYLRGEMSVDAAITRIQLETHRFLRHQMTSLRKMANVQWFDLSEADSEQRIEHTVARFLGGE
jgi:tRNA dimethylallyltransferase